MAKSTYKEQTVIKMVGMLDSRLTEDGKEQFICVVEDGDNIIEYDMNTVLRKMLGSEISISSASDNV